MDAQSGPRWADQGPVVQVPAGTRMRRAAQFMPVLPSQPRVARVRRQSPRPLAQPADAVARIFRSAAPAIRSA